MPDPATPTAVFSGSGWIGGIQSVIVPAWEDIIETCTIEEVIPVLDAVEKRVRDNNYYAFGWISYEASGAFGMPIVSPIHNRLPLVWFGFCSKPQFDSTVSQWEFTPSTGIPDISLSLSFGRYKRILGSIKRAIANGETYQTNLTLRAFIEDDMVPLQRFLLTTKAHPVPYAAWLHSNEWDILSFSPELFLRRTENRISTQPMKGTSKRGRTQDEDRLLEERLRTSPKDCAENIMILDMARNDLGRICRFGSVFSERICEVTKYRSLFQMTSTVHGELQSDASLSKILEAMFPAASITGAPKYRTMQLIRQWEEEPREVYCGSVAFIEPSGNFTMNVAIRSLFGKEGCYTLGVGGGIVWDSSAEDEYQEIKTKTRFLHCEPFDFALIETFLLNENRLYHYFDDHLVRLCESADYWDFPFHLQNVSHQLLQFAERAETVPRAVRLTLASDGRVSITSRPITKIPTKIRIAFSSYSLLSQNRFLFHKTTNRHLYDRSRMEGQRKGFFETLFINERGNVTEGCTTNVFYRLGSRWYTPPLDDGLLPGIWRKNYMLENQAEEHSIKPVELCAADEIRIGNSVIGAVLVDEIVYEFLSS